MNRAQNPVRIDRSAALRSLLWLPVFFSGAVPAMGAELQAKTIAAWETYVRFTEQRIDQEIEQPEKFLALDFGPEAQAKSTRAQLQGGQLDIHRMKTARESGREIEVDDGMIHHWIGRVFIPGVNLETVLGWVRDYDHHAGRFPEVIASKLVSRQRDTFQLYFKLRRKKIITVYYNSYYTASYHQKDSRHVFSRSHSTKIAQLDDPDTPQEKEKPVGEDSGFLWRLNSYWRYEEAPSGVYIECESVSLSRGIPFGFGWIIGSYVESVPRESLENTLTSIRDGVLQTAPSASR
ncbi:MAG: hypothetical protein HY316_06960 [Acidobacteria bacterium]|nr:hypothetical protein [Acidobacteriota bacterium]